jgi:glycerol-3-phosphate dehydrogenase
MPDSQLVVMEMLQQACRKGAAALNYTEAKRLVLEDNSVQGVQCVDLETGNRHTFQAKVVINAAGPWCRTLAASFDCDDPALFRYSIAWNILLNKPALSTHSVAVKPKAADTNMYFIHARHGLMLAGTVHAPWSRVEDTPMPNQEDIDTYLADLNCAIPGLYAQQQDILQIYSGLLPVQKQGTNTLSDREVIKDHGAADGPKGLYSISGVKFTTARRVAEKTIKTVFPEKTPLSADCIRLQHAPMLDHLATKFSYDWLPDDTSGEKDDSDWQETLSAIIEEQAVCHLDDLIIRRTTIGDNPSRAIQAAPAISRLFPWDEERRDQEILRLREYFLSRIPDGSITT